MHDYEASVKYEERKEARTNNAWWAVPLLCVMTVIFIGCWWTARKENRERCRRMRIRNRQRAAEAQAQRRNEYWHDKLKVA